MLPHGCDRDEDISRSLRAPCPVALLVPVVNQQDVAAAESDLTPLDRVHKPVVLHAQVGVKRHRAGCEQPPNRWIGGIGARQARTSQPLSQPPAIPACPGSRRRCCTPAPMRRGQPGTSCCTRSTCCRCPLVLNHVPEGVYLTLRPAGEALLLSHLRLPRIRRLSPLLSVVFSDAPLHSQPPGILARSLASLPGALTPVGQHSPRHRVGGYSALRHRRARYAALHASPPRGSAIFRSSPVCGSRGAGISM